MVQGTPKISKVAETQRFLALIQRYPDLANEARDFAARLTERHPDSSNDEICRGVEVAVATRHRGTIRAFISFKMTEQGKTAVRTLTEALRALTANRLEISSALDFVSGREWPAQIRRAVENANWFFLMLPEKSKDYDWMLFETGMFRAQMTLVDRLICLHHPRIAIAEQIAEFESVPAEADSIKNLLTELAIREHAVVGMPALNPAGGPLLEKMAQEIAGSIVPPLPEIDRTYHGRLLSLRIEHADKCDPDRLKDAIIKRCHKVECIFDRDRCPPSFGELVEGTVDFAAPAPWVTELCEAISRGATGKIVRPIQSTFMGAEYGRVFRPILHATDRLEEDGIGEIFHVRFLEDARVMSVAGIPTSLKVLAALVRQAFRFQWEILGQFNRSDLSEEDVKALEEAVCSLEADFVANGFSVDDVREAIGTQFDHEDQARIAQMHQLWNELRQEDGQGRLDRAMQDRDHEQVEEILGDLSSLANEYMAVLTKRFHEMAKSAPPGGVEA